MPFLYGWCHYQDMFRFHCHANFFSIISILCSWSCLFQYINASALTIVMISKHPESSLDKLLTCLYLFSPRFVLRQCVHWTRKVVQIKHYFVGAIEYANDVKLLGPALNSLTLILRVATVFGDRFDAIFNAAKTPLLYKNNNTWNMIKKPYKFLSCSTKLYNWINL